LLTPAFIVLGSGLFYLLFPQYFDPSLDPVRKLISDLNPTAELSSNLWPIFIAQAVQSTISAPIFNGLFTLGEEFGWRAYLLPKLMPLGQGKAMLWMGLIWGVWHAPIIAMGHNYGLDYPGAPWLGMLVMIWFCFSIGTLFGWATLRAGSVWPAVIGHAVINGISGFVVYTIQAQPSPLLGPLSMGLIASIPFFLFSLAVIIAPGATKTPAEVPILAPENN
jgi:membrane protease YdiL (CAAX protease family)